MDIIIYSQFVILILVVVAILIFIKKNNKKDDSDFEKIKEMMVLNSEEIRNIIDGQFNSSRKESDRNFLENRKEANDNFSKSRDEMSTNFVKNRNEQLTMHQNEKKMLEDNFQKITDDMEARGKEIDKKMERIMKDVESFSKLGNNIQSLLSTAQTRGSLGEKYLEELLKDHLGPPGEAGKGGWVWQRQYQFKSIEAKNLKADIVIKSPNTKMLVIDSKFPMDNFIKYRDSDDENKDAFRKVFIQDLKKHIDKVSEYIRPQEGTYDNAVMFLPTKGLFEAARFEGDIDKHARKMKVSLCGPGNVLLFLTVVLDNVRMDSIKDNLHEVIKRLSQLSKRANQIQESARLAIKNNRTHNSHLEEIEKQARLFESDVRKIDIDSNIKTLPEGKE